MTKADSQRGMKVRRDLADEVAAGFESRVWQAEALAEESAADAWDAEERARRAEETNRELSRELFHLRCELKRQRLEYTRRVLDAQKIVRNSDDRAKTRAMQEILQKLSVLCAADLR